VDVFYVLIAVACFCKLFVADLAGKCAKESPTSLNTCAPTLGRNLIPARPAAKGSHTVPTSINTCAPTLGKNLLPARSARKRFQKQQQVQVRCVIFIRAFL
jgi:hypothetical protein